MTLESLLKQIEQYLREPNARDVWEHTWFLARFLGWMREFLPPHELAKHRHAELLQQQIREYIEEIPRRLTPEQRLERASSTFEQLKYNFETLVGDMTLDPAEAAQKVRLLHREIEAFQWVSEGFEEEGAHLLAGASANLSLIERELYRVGVKELPSEEQQRLNTLKLQVAGIRQEMIVHEGEFYIQDVEALRAAEVQRIDGVEGVAATEVNIEPFRAPSSVEAFAHATPSLTARPDEDKHAEDWELLVKGQLLLLTIRSAIVRDQGLQDTAALTALFEKTQGECHALREKVGHYIADCTAKEAREWFQERVQQVLDQIDEQLAEIDDISLVEAVALMEILQDFVLWVLSLTSDLRERRFFARTQFDKLINQIDGFRRRIRAELQERKLQTRLETTFGRKAVEISENTVLWLILLVLVLLIVEASIPLPVQVRFVLMIVDTIVCALFLAEFGVKLWMAEGRLLYVRRHFLIDFLPSIPFSFLIWLWNPTVFIASLSGGRALRLVRVSRLARYVRIFRPLIRMFRLLSFMVRGTDRLLRKYETVFNRNIVLFPAPEDNVGEDTSSFSLELQTLRERCRKRLSLVLQKTEAAPRLALLEEQLRNVQSTVSMYGGTYRIWTQSDMFLGGGDISFEVLVNKMLGMDAVQVEEVLGFDFIRYCNRAFQLFSSPIIRSLPGFYQLARAHDELDTAALVAWFIRRVGGGLERIQSWIYWAGDFYGMVTGPQVLDRIGLTLVNATMRPARRLFMFGFLFLLVSGLINLFSFGALSGVSGFLGKYLGAPIIILGLLSMIPLLLGLWFRMIAGEATDFFARISEAQFIGRLKQIKLLNQDNDLRELLRRVLQAEEVLKDGSVTPESASFRQLSGHLQAMAVGHESSDWRAEPTQDPGFHFQPQWHAQEKVLQLYEDYLDGTPLHKSDRQTTNQLLGNIAIQNVRKHRLSLSLLEGLRIERLDLSRAKLLLYLGPYLWFASITDSLAHRVAQLIAEYNQNCIPLKELAWQSEESLAHYQTWRQNRKKKLAGMRLPVQRSKKHEVPFRTTTFTALHFLSNQNEQDEIIKDIFGEDVMSLMQQEREHLIRDLFGFFPFHTLPKEQRTVNFYQLYQSYASSGKIFLLPITLLWSFVKFTVWGVQRVLKLVRDVLQPPSHSEQTHPGRTHFGVAIRKINRMRKPVYIECMRLRALFDVEYLGLFLPGHQGSGIEGYGFSQDLDYIGAIKRERRMFEVLRETREKQLEDLHLLLEHVGLSGEQLHGYLHNVAPGLVAKRGEVIRAITACDISDYKKIRSLHLSFEALEDFVDEVLSAEVAPKTQLLRRVRSQWKRFWGRLFSPIRDKEYQRFELTCRRLATRPLSEEELRVLWRVYLARRDDLYEIFKSFAASCGEEDKHPNERISGIFDEVIREHSIWTEEMLSIRTLQTLTQLDIRLYRELVYQLGNYK